jgi:hypothetical protein
MDKGVRRRYIAAMQNPMVTQQEADRKDKDEGGAASGSWFPSLW